MDSISRLRENAFLVRRTQTARPFRVFGEKMRVENGAKECIAYISGELSNECLLAKFGFDAAENEPYEVCPLER